MTTEVLAPEETGRIKITFEVDVPPEQLEDVTVAEIMLAESLLTPGLQTAITMKSFIYSPTPKDLDKFKNKTLKVKMESFDGPTMEIEQTIYRLDNRRFLGSNVSKTEEYILHACDQSLLNDAKSLVSKSWKCTAPSEIVEYVLKNCCGVEKDKMDVEKAEPSRDYIAENIHPFRVVAQQANVALKDDDPSFVHFMTYKNKGTHVFKSLKTMSKADSKHTFKYSESGGAGGINNQSCAIGFSFPTDFDLLSDILNGINEKGEDKNTLSTTNPVSKSVSQQGNEDNGCGLGGFNYKTAVTNKGTAQAQNSCEDNVEKHLLKRMARMGLIERDKIALRLLAPWSPDLHAGDIITLDWKQTDGTPVYGDGNYMIVNLTHRIGYMGVGVTSLDCVAQTVGGGIV
jgi:hypothetical protein